MQVEHYQQKIKDMLKPQIEIVKLSLQDKRHKLVEETKKTLSKKMGIENKVKLLDKQDDDYEKMRLRHSKERDEMKLRHEKEDKNNLMQKQKLDKQIKKFFEGKTDRNYFDRDKVNKSQIYDVLDDMAETYADNRAKTMPEFSRINHLQRVLVACEDIVIESGTPDEMNAKLNGVFQSHVGIGWNRNENLAIESK
tara:strand:+ start:136 stop:720 length:585 start_codon:yes stop_codon:yes gene_type:complete